MDFTLRCNSLKCRKQLTERAVVTTCRCLASELQDYCCSTDWYPSHVFCNQCSDALGLTAAAGGQRLCPACQTVLTQPDDAVSTSLQPTEDYKTSVLSGLSPSTIMECAGRGLAFWSYQSTQEMWDPNRHYLHRLTETFQCVSGVSSQDPHRQVQHSQWANGQSPQ